MGKIFSVLVCTRDTTVEDVSRVDNCHTSISMEFYAYGT